MSIPQVGSAGDPLARSVLSALAYADLFDYPLTLEEITRYQIGTAYSREEIAYALDSSPGLKYEVSSHDLFYGLRGREEVFEARRQRAAASSNVWRRAAIYSRVLARMPFVRMVTVTGALAMDNISVRPDIDFLVVTRPGRVWIGRRFIISLVRLARLLGDDVCPNYVISSGNLRLEQQDLFTAHELAQMVPMYGGKIYREMIERNSWALEYLPQAFGDVNRQVPRVPNGFWRRIIETPLSDARLDGWERWEMKRLRRKVRPLVGDAAEVICSPQQCKGHTGLHRQRVTKRYSDRLSELGL